jgi:enamine deaminase RidA (YjgF/YER057c/UK114 family)
LARSTNPDRRLEELGLALPAPPDPVGSYVTAVRANDLVFLAAHGPWRDGELVLRGQVGSDLDLASAQEAARIVTLNLLGTLRQTLRSLAPVSRVVQLTVLVNSAPGFHEQHRVADAASDLMIEVFGPEIGRHARTAAGVAALPLGVSVVIEGVVAVATS